MQHTPTPWIIAYGGSKFGGLHVCVHRDEKIRFIATFFGRWFRIDEDGPTECKEWEHEGRANAEFAITAVNNHDTLVAALEWSLDWIDERVLPFLHKEALQKARAALAAVKEKK